ncbi:MAG: beta-hydroxyacyl-ACP dehydratase [Deltaproteobacteria bacterium]|nr:beta-hydroxyacyl-ACP dehydratase [Deltaproteobacteria bacterium]MBW2445183.1 beta-hydroxyacyl-ACP dehydratase [Deltaproteobacteria bacterium]
MGKELTPAEVLALLPQQDPFRFVDEIVEIDEEHVVALQCFRPDADFYRGHFPGNPVTPGVLLIEAMAQAGVVAQGIWLVTRDGGPEAAEKLVTVFTDADVEFSGIVPPGAQVRIEGHKEFFRRNKLRSRVQMTLEDGKVVCSGTLSGMGVPR